MHVSAGAEKPRNPVALVLLASLIGTTIEFFDFYIYANAAVLVFPKLFFPRADPMAGTLESLATFSIAFFARPVGSALFVFHDVVAEQPATRATSTEIRKEPGSAATMPASVLRRSSRRCA